METPPKERPVGFAQGEMILHPGWDDPMTEEELAEWEDSPLFPEETEEGLKALRFQA